METAVQSVGFIGVGNQGGPMARHIIEAGFPTTLWARRTASLEPYAGTNAKIASSAAELGRLCDLVEICVWNDVGVRDVLLGDEGVFAGMPAGGIVAIHSRISPDMVLEMGREGAARGIVVIDAPVSGDREVNEAGDLLVMVGGEAEPVERCRPVFSSFGGEVIHLDPLGSGALAKLVNNVLLASIIALTSDALDLGEDYGLDRDRLADALVHGSAAKGAALGLHSSWPGALPSGLAPGAPLPRVYTSWARKDVELAIDAAQSKGISTHGELLVLGLRAAALIEGRPLASTATDS